MCIQTICEIIFDIFLLIVAYLTQLCQTIIGQVFNVFAVILLKVFGINTSPINELPNEVLLKIFDNLDLKWQIGAEQVCHRWLNLIDWSLRGNKCLVIEDFYGMSRNKCRNRPYKLTIDGKTRFVSLESFHYSDEQTNYNLFDRFSHIYNNFSNLNKLFICFGCIEVTNGIDLFKSMINHLEAPKLIQISIILENNSLEVTEIEAGGLSRKFRTLRVFQLEANSLMIKEASIEVMLQNWKQIEVFILMSISNSERKLDVETHTGEGFGHLNRNIKCLHIPGFVFTTESINSLADKKPKYLTELKIFDIQEPTSMATIANFTSLSRLYCSSFGNLNTIYSGLFENISKLQNLEKLEILIKTNEKLPIIDSKAITHLKDCPKLWSLRIGSTPMAADEIKALSALTLKKLDLTYVQITPEEAEYSQWFSQNKDLKKIKISGLSENCFRSFLTGCPQLLRIDISECEHYSDSRDTLFEEMAINPRRALVVVFPANIRSISTVFPNLSKLMIDYGSVSYI